MHRSAAGPSRTRRLSIAVLTAFGVATAVAGPTTAAIEPEASPNHLDRPIVDVAVLGPSGPDGAPRLLTLDTEGMPEGVVRATILERDRAWSSMSESIIDFQANELGSLQAPWLIGLGPASFAVIAIAPEQDTTVVIGLRTDGGQGVNEVAEVGRTRLPIAIDDAGAADADGDGRPELVLAAARTQRLGGTCQGSELWTVEPDTLTPGSPVVVADHRIAGGVIGAFDEVPGDDLAVYAYPNCPAGPDRADSARLLTIRLLDGAPISDRPAAPAIGSATLATPLRVDVDRDGRDELVAQTPRGLTVLDPRLDGDGVRLASSQSIPLAAVAGVAGARSVSDDGPAPGATVAWLEPPQGRPGRIGTEGIRRDPVDGDLRGSPATVMFPNGEATERWGLIQEDIVATAGRDRPPSAWVGGIDDPACPDALLPGAVMGCATGDLAPGAAWIATRPLTLYGAGQRQHLLVASSVDWSPSVGLPESPAPWAAGPAGWWRHGPSGRFALAELRAGDATYYRDFPTPRTSLERATLPDATMAIPGFTGTRVLVQAAALGVTANDPTAEMDVLAALRTPTTSTGQAGVVRIPVPPGVDSGRDGGVTRVAVGDVTLLDGSPADRWSVTAVPLNDWGEIGDAVIGAVIRDRVGPSLAVDTPFVTPVWPLPAAIKGSAEPGSIVEVEGIGPVQLGRRGDFRIQTTLLPWPQSLRVTATDASGNETVAEVSLVGGVDYRRFPWPMIGAIVLLAVVALSGMAGSRWRRAAATVGGGAVMGAGAGGAGGTRSGGTGGADRGWAGYGDDGPVAEIEDLPPGQGIGRL